MASVFDVVKHATVNKTPWNELKKEEQEAMNKWMFQKVLSMNPDYVELVNIIQRNTWQQTPEMIYKCYISILPKKSAYAKYIKVSKKKEYKEDEVIAVAQYFEVSQTEAKKYIDKLPKEELQEIIEQINLK